MKTQEVISPRLHFDPVAHVYTFGGITLPSVTAILRAAGLSPDFSDVPPATLAAAQERGKRVHEGCEMIDRDDLDWQTVDPAIEGYLRAYENLCRDVDLRPIAVEESVHFGTTYAGTLDRLVWCRGERAVIDTKATAILSNSAHLQNAAYREAWNHMRPKEPVTKTFVAHLKPDGTHRLVSPPGDAGSTDTWWSAVRCYQWSQKYRSKK